MFDIEHSKLSNKPPDMAIWDSVRQICTAVH